MTTIFAQDGYRVRLEWGGEGVQLLAPHCAVLVVVDVLVFTTSVDVAVGRGAKVMPLRWRHGHQDTTEARAEAEAARQAGAVLTTTGLVSDAAGSTADSGAGWSLRPSSLVKVPEGVLLGIASPNGATLCAAAREAGTQVLAGCLRNVTAVARAARELAGDRPIGVIAGGERWRTSADRPLRPSVEDYLGAGAIVRALGGSGHSPEAELAATAFAGVADRLESVLADCVSGRELVAAGVPADVKLAGQLDVSAVAPVLVDGIFERWS